MEYIAEYIYRRVRSTAVFILGSRNRERYFILESLKRQVPLN